MGPPWRRATRIAPLKSNSPELTTPFVVEVGEVVVDRLWVLWPVEGPLGDFQVGGCFEKKTWLRLLIWVDCLLLFFFFEGGKTPNKIREILFGWVVSWIIDWYMVSSMNERWEGIKTLHHFWLHWPMEICGLSTANRQKPIAVLVSNLFLAGIMVEIKLDIR